MIYLSEVTRRSGDTEEEEDKGRRRRRRRRKVSEARVTASDLAHKCLLGQEGRGKFNNKIL